MSDERPDALLKSALEKIVYFEARSGQLHNDLESARADVARLERDLSDASQREIELRRTVAGLEVELTRAHRDRDELGRVASALREERTGLLEKLIEASRIHVSGSSAAEELEAPFDLAGFIAQLRSEALAAQRAPAAAAMTQAVAQAVATAPAVPVPMQAKTAPALALAIAPVRAGGASGHAERLRSEGRLHVSEEELARLAGHAHFAGRVEETVFGFSVRELSAPDAAARVRAAERLRALKQSAAAPPLAAALHAERDPSVLVALLGAFGEVASSEGVAIVLPLVKSNSADVRVAALKTLLALDATQAGPHLSAAMKDPDPAVRRRASLLALGLSAEGALGLGEQAVRDSDPEVRGLGALVLGAGGGERARELLLEALRDPEKKVRRAAAQSLSRIVGEDVSAIVDLDETQRRREVRRLAQLPVRPVRAMAGMPARRAQVPVPLSMPVAQPVAAKKAPADSLEPLCARIADELRCAIRGRTEGELHTLTRAPPERIHEACGLMLSRGHAVRRGTKLFAS